MEEESLEPLLIRRSARIVRPEGLAVQVVRLMDLIGNMIGDGDQHQKVVMAMVQVQVQVQHLMEEKGPGLGLVLVQELGLGLSQEEEEPQAVALAMVVGPDKQMKVVAQGVEMVQLLQVVEKGANTVKHFVLPL
ncbi:PREDICTED: uncharacterized protein LOC106304751 [Brassica oleracea var. oleracea]|uniref:uncharacterized protein LOC106304751 n=1 Tax=Brassica oleracea var. oleracea TaxID=109376 RepID=UPI0006A6C1FB|nr:PREDICTED: uncharacterized protein LOC106304751 [Brassica oleracea var. oleracea]